MRRVLPWPGDGPGFCNLHWSTDQMDPRGKPYWRGKAVKSPDDFMSTAKWAATTSGIKDLYFCLSQQSQQTTTKDGKPKVFRLAENAMALRSIWIDVDVKPPPKGYATASEALNAIMKFCADAGLPKPTALVGSGGGIHVYWISDKVLLPDVWAGYASGLRALTQKHDLLCDAGCTTDVARVLRIPGTLNYKTDPPKPVKLLYLAESDYDFSTVLAALPTLAPVAALATSTVNSAFDLSKFPKRFTAEKVESLSLGLEHEDVPLDVAPLIVSSGCGFIREAFATGGKDYDQPQWNLTTLAATFLANGHRLAHRMGNQHPGYSSETTDALWERKTRERHDKGLGWPSCSAIQAAGSKACGLCPHRGKIKSPLNLTQPVREPALARTAAPGPTGLVTATVKPKLSGAALDAALKRIPYSFMLDKDGHPCHIVMDKDGETAKTIQESTKNATLN